MAAGPEDLGFFLEGKFELARFSIRDLDAAHLHPLPFARGALSTKAAGHEDLCFVLEGEIRASSISPSNTKPQMFSTSAALVERKTGFEPAALSLGS